MPKMNWKTQLEWWKQAYDWWDQNIAPNAKSSKGGRPFQMEWEGEGDKLKLVSQRDKENNHFAPLTLSKYIRGNYDVFVVGGSYWQHYIDRFILKHAPIPNPPCKRPRQITGYDEWVNETISLTPA